MTEKVFKVFIARLEESAVNYHIHKNDDWQKQLEQSKECLLNVYKNQQKEIEQLKQDKEMLRKIILKGE